MTAQITYGNHLGDPSPVGASCLEAGKEDHQDLEASFREEGTRDQAGMADGLREVVRERLRKFRVEYSTHVHRTREEGEVHRIHQEGPSPSPSPCPLEARLGVVAEQDVEGRNRNLQEGARCQIRKQL
jgi:hypothetical protein